MLIPPFGEVVWWPKRLIEVSGCRWCAIFGIPGLWLCSVAIRLPLLFWPSCCLIFDLDVSSFMLPIYEYLSDRRLLIFDRSKLLYLISRRLNCRYVRTRRLDPVRAESRETEQHGARSSILTNSLATLPYDQFIASEMRQPIVSERCVVIRRSQHVN